jgi:alpha-amylase
MPSVCFYFQVHQPFRLRRYSVFDTDSNYFDDAKNAEILRKVAHKCYLPAGRVLLDLIRRHEGRFRIAFSITGGVVEQLKQWCPEALDIFQELAATGCVEFLAESYYHTMSFLYSKEDFREQVEMQCRLVKELFGQEPRVFRYTELIYNNDLARFVGHMGFDGIMAEGADHVLGFRSPNFVHSPPHTKGLGVLLKNYRLSDDIAFRFSNRQWQQWPLTAEKFARWVNQINGNGQVCNLFMDYETFGEHQWADTGIFEFLGHLPAEILKHPDNDFLTPSQIVDRYKPAGEIDVPNYTSWADSERDLSAWLGNQMQSNAAHELYKLEPAIRARGNPALLADWRKVASSDHFYYMCTKFFADGDVHKYFSPYESPYDSFINFMNVLDNLRTRAEG